MAVKLIFDAPAKDTLTTAVSAREVVTVRGGEIFEATNERAAELLTDPNIGVRRADGGDPNALLANTDDDALETDEGLATPEPHSGEQNPDETQEV